MEQHPKIVVAMINLDLAKLAWQGVEFASTGVDHVYWDMMRPAASDAVVYRRRQLEAAVARYSREENG